MCSACEDRYAVVVYQNNIGECTSCKDGCSACTSDLGYNAYCSNCDAGYYLDGNSCKLCGQSQGSPAGSTSKDACVSKLLFAKWKIFLFSF